MKSLQESILRNDSQAIEDVENNISLTDKALVIFKHAYQNVIKSNTEEKDIFGQELNPGDWFITPSYEHYGLCAWYIPDSYATIRKDGYRFEWPNRKGELRAYRFYGDNKSVVIDTSYIGDGPNGKILQNCTQRISTIKCKIKWPIKNLTVK